MLRIRLPIGLGGRNGRWGGDSGSGRNGDERCNDGGDDERREGGKGAHLSIVHHDVRAHRRTPTHPPTHPPRHRAAVLAVVLKPSMKGQGQTVCNVTLLLSKYWREREAFLSLFTHLTAWSF